MKKIEKIKKKRSKYILYKKDNILFKSCINVIKIKKI